VLIQGVFGLNACLGDQKVASQFVGRQDLHGLKFFVTANDVVIWNGSKVVNRYGYTLDASKLPGAIDFTRDGRVIRSGYGWNDNDTVLLIALGSNLEDRPAQEGKPAVQLVLRAECLGMPFDKVQNSPDIVSSETKKILHALVSQTDLDVTDMPLRDVVEYLQEYHGVKITLDEKALAKAGVDRETPLTMKMNPTLDAVLTILLTPLGLTYKIENDQIVITTAQ
jgi:hypothetical protein